VIPFRDNIPSRRTPVFTVLLIAANVAVFLVEAAMNLSARQRLIERFGVIPYKFKIAGRGPHVVEVREQRPVQVGPFVRIDEVVREVHFKGTWAAAIVPLFTSMFMHGGWMHVIGNMWFLWLFGDNVEDRLGRGRFLILYIVSGLIAGLTQVLVNWGEVVPIIGASGAVAGILGAYMVSYPYARILTLVPFFYFFWPVVELPAITFLGFWFLMQFFQGTAALAGASAAGVAWWAHMGGFVAGIILVGLLAPVPHGRRGPGRIETREPA